MDYKKLFQQRDFKRQRHSDGSSINQNIDSFFDADDGTNGNQSDTYVNEINNGESPTSNASTESDDDKMLFDDQQEIEEQWELQNSLNTNDNVYNIAFEEYIEGAIKLQGDTTQVNIIFCMLI